jgi:hypothetical protein
MLTRYVQLFSILECRWYGMKRHLEDAARQRSVPLYDGCEFCHITMPTWFPDLLQRSDSS